MEWFVIVLTGAAVALSSYSLVSAVAGMAVDFDRRTVEALGLAGAFFAYGCAGPVLIVRGFDRAGQNNARRGPVLAIAATLILAVWTMALGIVAVESGSALLLQ